MNQINNLTIRLITIHLLVDEHKYNSKGRLKNLYVVFREGISTQEPSRNLSGGEDCDRLLFYSPLINYSIITVLRI
jgi:hypothetical protein